MSAALTPGSAIMGYALSLLATVIWAGNFVIARGLHDAIAPVALAFWRWVIALLVLTPIAWRALRADWPRVKRHWRYLTLTGLFGVSLFNTLIYMAGHTTEAINLSIISASSPVFVVVFSAALAGWFPSHFSGERLSPGRVAGLVLALIGVIWLVSDGAPDRLLHMRYSRGDIEMLIAALTFALYTLLIRRKPAGLSMPSLALSTFALGVLMLAPFYFWELYTQLGHGVHSTAPTLSVLGALVYVGVCASVVAYLAWNKAISLIGASRTAVIYYAIPVFSGLAGWLVLHEPITGVHIVSMVLIIAGIVIATRPGRPTVAVTAPAKSQV